MNTEQKNDAKKKKISAGIILISGFLFLGIMYILACHLPEPTGNLASGSGNGRGGAGGGDGRGTSAEEGDGTGAGTHGTDSGSDNGTADSSVPSDEDEGDISTGMNQAEPDEEKEEAEPEPQEQETANTEAAPDSAAATAAITGSTADAPPPPPPAPNVFLIRPSAPPPPAPPKAAPRPRGTGKAIAGKPGKTGFYGVEITEKNIIFILDISGSMNSSSAEGGTRLEVMRKEVVKALSTLQKEKTKSALKSGRKSVRLLTFSDQCTVFSDSGKKAFLVNKHSIRKIEDFLNQTSACGGTAMMSSFLETAAITKKHRDVDAVYLLSDGDPQETPQQLLDFMKAEMPEHVRIHTFSIGQTSEFLKNLAEQHGGRYVECF